MIDQYLVGKIADNENPHGGLVIISAIYGNGIPSDEIILNNAVNQLGGVDTDYAIYKLDSTSSDGLRIKNGDELSLHWTANEITSIDFELEEAKLWINVSVDKMIVKKDGVDYLTVTTNMIKADGSGIDTTFNDEIVINILTPAGIKPLLVKFTDGVCEYPFQPADHTNATGNYKIPAGKVDGFRVEKSAEFIGVIPVG